MQTGAELPPPKKVACGLFHTTSICNLVRKGDRTVFLTGKSAEEKEDEKERQPSDKAELYSWGRNSNNVLGASKTWTRRDVVDTRDRLSPEKVARDFFGRFAAEGYEVACGANHSLYVIRCTAPGEKGEPVTRTDVFAFGLGDYGRLGMPKTSTDTSKAGSESWFTNERAKLVQFSTAYTVTKLVDTKSEGVPYYESVAAYSRNEENKGVFEWDSCVHLVPAAEEGWYQVQGNFEGPRLMQMTDWLVGFQASVLRVCCGSDHSLCLLNSGWLFAWGLNEDGQCGVGGELGEDRVDCVWSPTPVCFAQKQGLVSHFAAGARHSMMTHRNGRLFSWGCSKQGRLGLGKVDGSQNVPQPVVMKRGESEFAFCACGEAHSGAIDSNRNVWMWGAGAHGRLGLGELLDVPTPRQVEVLEDVEVKQLALGGFHTIALSVKPHKVFSWGMGHAVGQSPDGEGLSFSLPQNVSIFVDDEDLASEVTQIAAGTYHTVFLLKDGRLAACGLGLSGRLGNTHQRNVGIPNLVSAQVGFALQIQGDAALMKFKHASEQAAADDKKNNEIDTEGKKKWNVKQLGCGVMSSAALTIGGSVYVWGDNSCGQLGLKENQRVHNAWLPKRLAFAQPVKTMAIGFEHCLAVTDVGIYVWGKGDTGQLGTGRTHSLFEPTLLDEKHLPGSTNIIGVAAGDDHSCAIVSHTDSSELYTWGSAEMGKLGIYPVALEQYLRPSKVECDFDKKFPVVVVCGPYHTALIVAEDVDDREGELWMFGGGTYGRLGVNEDQQNILKPMRIEKWPVMGNNLLKPTVSAVACGSYHTCAITKDLKRDTTELMVWGHKDAMCEVEHSLRPKRFSLIEGGSALRFESVACNASHSFVIATSGEVYAWGKNGHGQLAVDRSDGSGRIDKPEYLKNIPGSVELLATGPQHAMALLSNGNMYAWGTQSCGRLGLEWKKPEKIVRKPHMVKAEWASIEEITTASGQGKSQTAFTDDHDFVADVAKGEGAVQDAAEKEEGDETFDKSMIDSLKSGQKVQLFATMQSLLKNEPEASREQAFKKVEEDLSKKLRGYLQDIRDLPEKEKGRVHSEGDLSVALSATVRHIQNGKLKAPDVGSGVNERILIQMKNYEDMMWVLQQQPCYLSTLSMCNLAGDDLETFHTVIEYLYKDLQDGRTLHLFMALLKMLITKEVEHAKGLGEVFSPATSRVFRVFQWFAVQPVHYESVVYNYMKRNTAEEDEKAADPKAADKARQHDKKDSKRKWSLYRRIVEASLKSQIFALTEDDYKRQGRSADLTPEELQAKFIIELEKFKDFMQTDFLQAIVENDLHPNVQALLSHSLRAIQGRRFPELFAGDQRIPQDLLVCQPLLTLIVSGLLARILSSRYYAGEAVWLPKQNAKEYEECEHNMRILCQFLQNMVAGKYEDSGGKDQAQGNRLLVSIARFLKPGLLKYVQEQASYVDQVETDLIIDVFTTHFDVRPRMVSVPTSCLLQLSNLMRRHENKLRQNDEDLLDRFCRNIGTWSPEDIEAVRPDDKDKLHNFVINHRFLLTEPEFALTICRASQCPMPPRLCSTPLKDTQGYSVIQMYAVELVDQPWKALEEIFREIADVRATTFSDLAVELEGMLKDATVKTPPNYALAHRLDGAIAKVKDMDREDQSVRDVLQHMSDKLLSRTKHQIYLEQVSKGIHIIRKAKLTHALALKRAETELYQMVKFATGLVLPKALKDGMKGEIMTLDKVSKRQFMSRTTNLEKLGGSTFLPSKTIAYKELLNKKVLAKEMDEKVLPKSWDRNTTIKFTSTNDGGVSIEVGVKQKKSVNTLRSILLDKDQIRDLQRAAEGSTLSLPPDSPALVFNSTALNTLLTRLMET